MQLLNTFGLFQGVGEPPFFLATSVFFAIKHAIGSARKDSNLFGRFRIDSPATAERIRMACGDVLTKQVSCKRKQFFKLNKAEIDLIALFCHI